MYKRQGPTAFRFANGGGFSKGIMGEAGPEAVIPLRRGADGKLGVSGGGDSITNHFNITMPGQVEPMSDWRFSKAMEDGVAASMRKKSQRRGGF